MEQLVNASYGKIEYLTAIGAMNFNFVVENVEKSNHQLPSMGALVITTIQGKPVLFPQYFPTWQAPPIFSRRSP